ncbi:hypothetical protein [Clostridium sp.]|uniref:hypothetical protein n=1 Tax=Clostridium sp. TaxID=1506 RepID=UPI003F4B10F0
MFIIDMTSFGLVLTGASVKLAKNSQIVTKLIHNALKSVFTESNNRNYICRTRVRLFR